jgi:hypothetical protein
VDRGPTGQPVNRGAGLEVGQPLASRLSERATVLLAQAGGHQGDQTGSAGSANQRGGRDVAGQPAAAADELLPRPVLLTSVSGCGQAGGPGVSRANRVNIISV